jgi:predicted site-specific integrase-resolvase
MVSRMTPDDMIGSREVCRILNIDKATLARWVKAGRLEPVLRLGDADNSAFVYRRADVEALIAA